jgi:hypothetical protein
MNRGLAQLAADPAVDGNRVNSMDPQQIECAKYKPNSQRNFPLMKFEPRQDWTRATLDAPGREMFVRKAKADRFAWEAAELLAKGKHADASNIALQGIALIGQDDFTSSCKRYATSVFQVPPNAAKDFFDGLLRSV